MSSSRKSARPHSSSLRTWPAASPAKSPTWTAATTSWVFSGNSGGRWLHLERDPPRVTIERCHHNLPLAALHHTGKFLSPLHQHDAVIGLQIVKPQRLQLALALDTVEIQVIEPHRRALAVVLARAFILMHQSEGRTRHLVRIRRVVRLGNPLHQRGLARAQVAA